MLLSFEERSDENYRPSFFYRSRCTRRELSDADIRTNVIVLTSFDSKEGNGWFASGARQFKLLTQSTTIGIISLQLDKNRNEGGLRREDHRERGVLLATPQHSLGARIRMVVVV